MKGILGLIVLLAIGVGAWALFPGGTVPEPTSADGEAVEAEVADEASDDSTDTAPDPDIAESVEEELQDGLDNLKDEAEAATDALKEDVEDAVTEAEDKVDETLETVREEADDLLDRGSNQVQRALENALGGSGQTGGGQGAGEPSETDPAANLEHDADAGVDTLRLEEALSVDGFDGLAIREALERSELGEDAKNTIESLITSGEQNIDQRQVVIDQIRALMGL